MEVDQLDKLKTGVAGLDTLLHGGLVAGASYIVQGRPGSGKTVLANQAAFNHALGGGRVLFITLLSESHERLLQFLSTMSFFDPGRIGGEIQYVSAFDTMETEGLDAVVRLMRREIGRQKATLLVIDGLLNARSRAETQMDTKKFIAELQSHASFAGCTVLFLTSAYFDDSSPEHTMVDGIIELGEQLYGSRPARWMHVRKTRGSAAMLGLHQFEITSQGVIVHPRLETVVAPTLRQDETSSAFIVSSGVPSLDEMLGGGWVQGSSTLLMGPSGAGKTTMALSFAACATPEAPVLYFSLCETSDRLKRKGDAVGLPIRALADSGALKIVWTPAIENGMDALAHHILAEARTLKASRVVIDSLGALYRACIEPDRWPDFLTALADALRCMGVSVMMVSELREMSGADVQASAPELAGVVDNLLLARFIEVGPELRRSLSVLKVRDGIHDPSRREMIITNQGLTLAPLTSPASNVDKST